MSLIEEALRRLKDPLITTTPEPPPTKPGAQKIAPQEAASIHPWSTTPSTPVVQQPAQPVTHALVAVAVAVLALTLALIIGGALWMKRTMGTMTTPHPIDPIEEASPPPVRAPDGSLTTSPRAAMPLSKQNELILSGVAEGLGESYAVINGTIVRVGEQVQDATLMSVTNGVVTLRRADGKDVTLRVVR